MKITSTTLKQIAAMPAEAMAVSLLFLAGQLEQHERKQVAAAERQSRWRNAHSNAEVTPVSRESNADVTPLARVLDNNPSFLTSGKKEEESKIPPITPPSSKPLEPPGFAEWFSLYPKRAGGADRKPASKAFAAALKRTSLQELTSGVCRYAAFCDANGNTGTQYVLKPRKWLNDHGWENTYETARTNHKPNSIASGFALIDRAIEERFGNSETDTSDLPRLLKIAS